MKRQTSRKHHFVPKFLLKPWVLKDDQGQKILRGYWWDNTAGALRCKMRGLESFCFQMDLLSLRDRRNVADQIERGFFGEVDRKGAEACQVLLTRGPKRLSREERCDFARLLHSLDTRLPQNVQRIRNDETAFLRASSDSDPDLISQMASVGVDASPSGFYEEHYSILEDRALSMVVGLTDNPEVGGFLINSIWQTRDVISCGESFILSDRPLIRVHGYDRLGGAWMLPMSPKKLFVACNHGNNMDRIMRASARQLVKKVNVQSAAQSHRFVFAIDRSHEFWLPKYVNRR